MGGITAKKLADKFELDEGDRNSMQALASTMYMQVLTKCSRKLLQAFLCYRLVRAVVQTKAVNYTFFI